MMRFMKVWGCGLLAAALVGCGGGGGSAGSTPGNPGGGSSTSQPASVELFASSTVLGSAPSSTVTFTALVKDQSNRSMPKQEVTFTASSGNLVGALPLPTTGEAGEPVTGITLTPGADRSTREIQVTAKAGSVQRTLTINVTGTTLSLTSESTLLLGGSTILNVTARDSSGQPIPGATISASSTLGNTIAPASAVTGANGAASFQYRADRSGVDTVTLSGLGVVATASIAISSEDFSFESPPAGTAVPIGTSQVVTVRLLSGGVPAAGRAVTFSTTRGTVTPTSAVTGADGRVSASISSTTSGPATISARSGDAQSLLSVTYLATTPASLILQANPGAVAPNPAGSTANSSVLTAMVRDAAGNPVAGKLVNFTAQVDPSNGTISPGSGVTDANGVVETTFRPGALSTPNEGVVIRASVQGTAISGAATLTVSGQALFISISRGRLIGTRDEPNYRREFSVYVTDVNGGPVANQAVTLALFAPQYRKGFMVLPTAEDADTWLPFVAATCANEDAVERNGILTPAKDINGNGKLDPGLPAVVTPASVVTDSSGFATFFIEYGKNYAEWVDVIVTARARVSGTESVQTHLYPLALRADDASTEAAPPNAVSPFGISSSCTDPN